VRGGGNGDTLSHRDATTNVWLEFHRTPLGEKKGEKLAAFSRVGRKGRVHLENAENRRTKD